METSTKYKGILVGLLILTIIVYTAFALLSVQDAKASRPGIWVCIAVAECSGCAPEMESCDATGRDKIKTNAEKLSLARCFNKCIDVESFKYMCRVQGCFRRK
jgi:hypothetical protein